MAGENLTLGNLVEAIMNSIADAQDQIERQTLDNINEWFDDEGRPKMVTFKLPSLHPDAIEESEKGNLIEREVQVPLLTLMQNNPIKIKRLVSKFEVALGGVEEVKEEPLKGKKPLLGSGTSSRTRKILSTDLFAGNGTFRKKKRHASIEIEFESGEPTEAYLKIQNELLKLI